MADRINHSDVRYRTKLPVGTPRLWERAYRALEHKATSAMSGWNNVRGVTPDDLAQGVWLNFVEHIECKSYEDSIRLTSYALGQDAMDLYRKTDLEVYATESEPDFDADPEDDAWDPEAENSDLVPRYLNPDTVDWMAEHLTERELEVMILHIEEDLTVTQISQAMGLSKQAVSKTITRSGDKLRPEVDKSRSRPYI